jgi:hypothetical protein
MYSPYLHQSLADARADDLRRAMAASRDRRSLVGSRSDRRRHQSAPTNAIRALVARLAQ